MPQRPCFAGERRQVDDVAPPVLTDIADGRTAEHLAAPRPAEVGQQSGLSYAPAVIGQIHVPRLEALFVIPEQRMIRCPQCLCMDQFVIDVLRPVTMLPDRIRHLVEALIVTVSDGGARHEQRDMLGRIHAFADLVPDDE